MSKTLLACSGTTTQNQNTTTFYTIADSANKGSATEARMQCTWRVGGVLSLLSAQLYANSLSVTTTIRTRKGGANGNQSITFLTTVTGTATDGSNTDTVGTGENWNFSVACPAGTGSISIRYLSCVFDATSNTVQKYGHATNSSSFSTVNASAYWPYAGEGGGSTTEANAQTKMKTAGTLKNLFVKISANGKAINPSLQVYIRKNAADGNTNISFGSSATGTQEDTSNTDTVAVDDLWSFRVFFANAAGTITFQQMLCDLETTNSRSMWVATPLVSGTGTINNNLTRYFCPQGNGEPMTTETDVQLLSQLAPTLSKLECYISANTVSATSTLKLRKNAGNGNQSVSITASTTGWFEDASNTDTPATTDLVDYQLVTGATGTSLTLQTMACLFDNSGGAVATGANPFDVGRALGSLALDGRVFQC